MQPNGRHYYWTVPRQWSGTCHSDMFDSPSVSHDHMGDEKISCTTRESNRQPHPAHSWKQKTITSTPLGSITTFPFNNIWLVSWRKWNFQGFNWTDGWRATFFKGHIMWYKTSSKSARQTPPGVTRGVNLQKTRETSDNELFVWKNRFWAIE